MVKRLPALLAIILILTGCGLVYNSHRYAASKASSIVKNDDLGQDVHANLAELKDYSATHMGATASVTLTGSYNRAQAEARVAAQAATAASAKVYTDAQQACSGKTDSITQARCNAAYLAAHQSSVPTPAPVAAPELATYQYHFAAPLWSADLAGALILGGVVAGIFALFGLARKKRA